MPTLSHGAATALRALLERIVTGPAPFYVDRLASIWYKAAGNPIDLASLPFTTRDDLLHDQLAHLPYGTRRCADASTPVRTGVTGSGATLLVLTWTAADLRRERAAGARLLGSLGINPGMCVANTLPGALVTPGALLLGDVVEDIGALDIPLGAVTSAAAVRAAWTMFDRVRPDVLVADIASAGALLADAPPAARPWWHGIIWLQTDAPSGDHPLLPAAAGFSGWQRTWLAVAEATSFVAHSCSTGCFHADDAVIVEVVDPTASGVLPTAKLGTVALTPLGVDTAVLRYSSGLRARLVSGCPCGHGGVVLELAS